MKCDAVSFGRKGTPSLGSYLQGGDRKSPFPEDLARPSARCHIPESRNMEWVRYVIRTKTLTVVWNRLRPVPVLTQYDVGKKSTKHFQAQW